MSVVSSKFDYIPGYGHSLILRATQQSLESTLLQPLPAPFYNAIASLSSNTGSCGDLLSRRVPCAGMAGGYSQRKCVVAECSVSWDVIKDVRLL